MLGNVLVPLLLLFATYQAQLYISYSSHWRLCRDSPVDCVRSPFGQFGTVIKEYIGGTEVIRQTSITYPQLFQKSGSVGGAPFLWESFATTPADVFDQNRLAGQGLKLNLWPPGRQVSNDYATSYLFPDGFTIQASSPLVVSNDSVTPILSLHNFYVQYYGTIQSGQNAGMWRCGIINDGGLISDQTTRLEVTWDLTNANLPSTPTITTQAAARNRGDTTTAPVWVNGTKDLDGDLMYWVGFTQPWPVEHCGVAYLNSDYSITFTRNGSTEHWAGLCTLNYTLHDGCQRGTGQVILNVTDIRPITGGPKFYTHHWTVWRQGVYLPNVMSGAFDPEGQNVTLVSMDLIGQPDVLNVTLFHPAEATNVFVMTRNESFGFSNSSSSFSYTITDTWNLVTERVYCVIQNALPVAAADYYVVNGTFGDVTYDLPVMINDYDPDQPTYDNVLTISSWIPPARGIAWMNEAKNGFVYQPESNWTGTAVLTYTLNDGSIDGLSGKATIFVRNYVNDQQILTWGQNSVGQLGVGDLGNRYFPEYFQDLSTDTLKQVCGTTTQTFFILTDNWLWVAGAGTSLPMKKTPYIEKMSCGTTHVVFKKTDGSLYTSGNGQFGKLGLGDDTTDKPLPSEVPGYNVTLVAAGGTHSIAWNGATLIGFGANSKGQLGIADPTDKLFPTTIPFTIPGKEKIKMISLGNSHSFILSNKGRLWVFGANDNGQLGLGHTISISVPTMLSLPYLVNQVVAGSSHSLIVSLDGKAYGTGKNDQGALGLGHTNPVAVFTEISGITADFVTVGLEHSFIVSHNLIWAFGSNPNGNLGIGNGPSFSPTPRIVINRYSQATALANGAHVRKCTLPGLTGPECASPTCYGVNAFNSSSCSKNGECVGTDTCSCDKNVFGVKCDVQICFGIFSNTSTACSGKGICSATNQCDCVRNYGGLECETFLLCNGRNQSDPLVCNVRGQCNHLENCTCNAGYSGTDCELTMCNGIAHNATGVCNGRGSCTSPDSCTCTAGWSGSDCQSPKCYGLVATDANVCGGKGSCTGIDTCVCQSGYFGDECKSWNCFGDNITATSVCTGHGVCAGPDTCTCLSGYSGSRCDNYNCFGISVNSSSVCNSGGNCTNIDVCTCRTGYSGKQCETPPDNGTSLYYLILLAIIPIGLVAGGVGIVVIVIVVVIGKGAAAGATATAGGKMAIGKSIAIHDLGI